jgi:hypothetical protein
MLTRLTTTILVGVVALPIAFVNAQERMVRVGQMPPEDILELSGLAALAPDRAAWQLFVQIFAPSGTGLTMDGWATDDDTFTTTPKYPPVLSDRQTRAPALRVEGQQVLIVPSGGGEEVRRNEISFRYIVDHSFNLVSGLKAAIATKQKLEFPAGAVEIKLNWAPAQFLGNLSHHYIDKDVRGNKVGLYAMHIMAKLNDNWFWATFEHESIRGRCDYMGCMDSFGAKLPVVAPAEIKGEFYGACEKSHELSRILADAGFGPEWDHYCLKGTQTNFVDSKGDPILLGNSVIEMPVISTSSCITCHARAVTDMAGGNPHKIGMVPCENGGSPCSPNGAPDPLWFRDATGAINVLQSDYVWSIPFCAVPEGQRVSKCRR